MRNEVGRRNEFDVDDDDDDNFETQLGCIDLPDGEKKKAAAVVTPERQKQNQTKNITNNRTVERIGAIDLNNWTIHPYSTVDKKFNGSRFNELVCTDDSWSTGVTIVQATELEVTDAEDCNDGSVIRTYNDEGVFENVVTNTFAPGTNACFRDGLKHLGIGKINNGSDMLTKVQGKLVPANAGLTFLVITNIRHHINNGWVIIIWQNDDCILIKILCEY